jgi:methylated-DNA-[protein]-cysteine S-methyltransferase
MDGDGMDAVKRLSYITLPSAFGTFNIVWQEVDAVPKVCRIFLSNEQASSESIAAAAFAEAGPREHPEIVALGERIQRFLEGQAVQFDLGLMALEVCSEFQRRVLLAEYGIPRGRISTYGRIGKHLGLDNGGRAVGRALAQNPFPIVIPCHRAVRPVSPGGSIERRVGRIPGGLEDEAGPAQAGGGACV